MTVRVEEREEIAIITLDRPPANAFDPAFVESIGAAFRGSSGAPGVLLASALPSMFSAGWDLPALLSGDRTWMKEFVESFCNLVREIFTFDAPVVAALPGHAIAGGLILAASVDERYAARGKGQFGLSEVPLGVPVPRCCLEVFRHALGDRAAERLASTGENHSVEGAAEIGLIDRIVDSDELFDRALDRVVLLAKLPRQVYALVKSRARSLALTRFDDARRGDPFLDFWFGADAQERIGRLVAKLKKPRAASVG